jgi:hypothetical protein|tara:strand:+ start:203 stop:562 length:360 start_codon:yes stop_codon:yes gene_type:complete
MSGSKRLVDQLVEAFDLNQRRKFVLKDAAGKKIEDLYFKPITRADRKKAQDHAGSSDALEISTQMLCQMAELEDGTKPFAAADAAKLHRKLPENVLNELELFLFGVADANVDIDEAKND